MNKPQIIIITGDLESGKTSLCQEIIRFAQKSGINTTGLVSPGIFRDGLKTAIDVQDISTGESRRLAELRDHPGTGLETKRWSFSPEAVSWGNRVLTKATPSDLLIIDELGPLEFNRAEGWVAAFEVIDQAQYQAALLVIRPSLVQQASRRWEIKRVLDLSGSGPFPRTVEEFIASFNLIH
jgi:nucleoside-triphosphatase THEP1